MTTMGCCWGLPKDYLTVLRSENRLLGEGVGLPVGPALGVELGVTLGLVLGPDDG